MIFRYDLQKYHENPADNPLERPQLFGENVDKLIFAW